MRQGFLNFGHRAFSGEHAPVDVRACRVIVSVSGGKDSAAASLLLKEHGIEHDRVFMDTGWEHPETYKYLRGPLTDALGPILELRGELDFVELVRKKGLFPSRVMRFCTTELKVLPIIDYIALVAANETREIVNVVGIRRAESAKRSKMPEWEWSDDFGCWTWRPLVDWHQADVLAIHEQHGLAVNPLYHLGASRVGCWPCIHARKAEIAIVAKVDPARIRLIEQLEDELCAKGHERDAKEGRPFVPRTMFSFHNGKSEHFPLPIRHAINWARSDRGEWQPAGEDGCARFGLCSALPEDEDVELAPLPLFEGGAP